MDKCTSLREPDPKRKREMTVVFEWKGKGDKGEGNPRTEKGRNDHLMIPIRRFTPRV